MHACMHILVQEHVGLHFFLPANTMSHSPRQHDRQGKSHPNMFLAREHAELLARQEDTDISDITNEMSVTEEEDSSKHTNKGKKTPTRDHQRGEATHAFIQS